ncbi:small acid-soluble spore protein O [Amphibacillus sediminis]|uniref:small acid-soluble spore protein O n=1 Tax=Amphibacillus sediminis TaxID=360185 RepID=UPI0012EE0892|nr:small acid-soluble spore protein O [Amphibacillus sediminis]
MKHDKKERKQKGRNDHETIKETSPRQFEHEFANEPMTPVELDRNKIQKRC